MGEALVVAVPARAVDGAANAAVISALAMAFGVRRRDVALIRGHAARDKLVEITSRNDTRTLLRSLLGEDP